MYAACDFVVVKRTDGARYLVEELNVKRRTLRQTSGHHAGRQHVPVLGVGQHPLLEGDAGPD